MTIRFLEGNSDLNVTWKTIKFEELCKTFKYITG